ncbi:MAG TPA: ABC transporter substrate-binding protein [Gemmatimonadales bacterium]|jgi:peptide/nickel transport system substrate-binding protein
MPRCLAVILSLTLAGCAAHATSRQGTIIFASGADLQSINSLVTVHPLARQVQRYVLFTTLVQRDSTLQIVPYLARRWSWSPDRTTLTMVLADGIRWHDGAPTTAADVAWTFNAARDPATGYPRISELASLTNVVAIGDTAVRFTFAAAQSVIPDLFTDLAILPVHLLGQLPHAALRQAAWNDAPVGNGPFRFVSHTANRRWVFAADSQFPIVLGGPPHIARFVVAVVDEPTTKLAALTSGELDFAGIQPAHASFVRSDRRLTVLDYPLLLTYVMLFNTRRPPFNDLTVRRAISLALDRRAIVDGDLFGFGTPAAGPAAQDTASSGSSRADVAAARRLLAGRHLHFELLTVGSGEAALEQMIQGQLAAVGIQVTIRQLENTAFLDRVHGGQHDFDVAMMGISGDIGLGQVAPMLADAGIPAPASPAAARIVAIDSVAAAFVYHARGVQGMNRRVHGVHMDLRGELASLHSWTLNR